MVSHNLCLWDCGNHLRDQPDLRRPRSFGKVAESGSFTAPADGATAMTVVSSAREVRGCCPPVDFVTREHIPVAAPEVRILCRRSRSGSACASGALVVGDPAFLRGDVASEVGELLNRGPDQVVGPDDVNVQRCRFG